MFITFEGIDGSGKTTQATMLATRYIGMGHRVVRTREPGGTPACEKIREIIFGDREGDITGWETDVLLFAASRSRHIRSLIAPSLNEKRIVICDRFVHSSYAYQGYNKERRDMVRTINDIAMMVPGFNGPDLKIFIATPPSVAMGRMDREDAEKSLNYHQRVNRSYWEVIDEDEGNGWVVISGQGTKEEVHNEVMNRVNIWLSVDKELKAKFDACLLGEVAER